MSRSTPIAQTYDLLTSLLALNPSTVELVPGDGSSWISQNAGTSYEPFLFVENNLGIPQKILYSVYLHAVGVFNTALRKHPPQTSNVTEALIASSSVLILANPSHQTALNTRKQLVREEKIDPCRELQFIASLLPSHHCAKHAELWYHRRWLLSIAHTPRQVAIQSNTEIVSSDTLLDIAPDSLRPELDLTARACELYPRNYFAWTHRLICTRSLLRIATTFPEERDKIISMLRCEIAEIKRWIEYHVSDYSAVHYITTLVQCLHQANHSFLRDTIKDAGLFGHASSLVRAYPDHESLWMYARTSFLESDPHSQELMERFLGEARSMSEQSNGNLGGNAASQCHEHAQRYLSRKWQVC
ncbi:hypothetical protein F5I97DRAFT_196669 [Phlebopus sp. FC_14]|nr:hypothetical protein F5I97DRAFT_196669 [Phlebopus sp. FC_14]